MAPVIEMGSYSRPVATDVRVEVAPSLAALALIFEDTDDNRRSIEDLRRKRDVLGGQRIELRVIPDGKGKILDSISGNEYKKGISKTAVARDILFTI
jgi:hypothetical protein